MTKNKKEIITRLLSEQFYNMIEEGRTEVLKKHMSVLLQLKKEDPEKFKESIKKATVEAKELLKDNNLILEALHQAKIKKAIKNHFKSSVEELANRIDAKRAENKN
jgi:DNA-binding GntR family transcriptional regulator